MNNTIDCISHSWDTVFFISYMPIGIISVFIKASAILPLTKQLESIRKNWVHLMGMNRKNILLTILGISGMGMITKKIFDYKKENPVYSKESWLLQRSFSFFTWPFNLIESDFLYNKSIQLLSLKQKEHIKAPDIQSVKMTEYLLDNMQVFILNDQKDSEQKVVFFLHGGGYLSPPTPPHFDTAVELAQQTGAKIVMPNYPKAPNYTFKDAYPKVLNAYKRMLISQSSRDNITILGDSSGGGFAVGLSSLLVKENIPQPKKIVLISPWLDASSDNPDLAKNEDSDTLLPAQRYLKATGRLWAGGEKEVYNPLVSPIYSDNLSQLPPIYIITGNAEMLYPDVLRFKDKMTKMGHGIHLFIKEGMVHDFALFNTPEGKEARNYIGEVVNK